MMAGIKGKDTKPEILVRKALFRKGFRYRLHYKGLPGKPDLVFPSRKAVIFVNGCFWHAHDCHLFKWPSTRRRFWKEKILGNKKRDQENFRKSTEAGWRVLVIWECALKGKSRLSIDTVTTMISKWLESKEKDLEISGN